MKFKLDPFSPNGISLVDEQPVIITGSSSDSSSSVVSDIPQYDADPVSPTSGSAWVLKSITGGTGGGAIVSIMGGGFVASTPNTGGSTAYQFSYRTIENITIRATLT